MPPIPRSLAALATIPGREGALEETLRSLRPQVEKLHVVCHDMREPPACVRELADLYVCEPDRAGSAAALRFAPEHAGLFLKCDDDWRYPPDYVETMRRWVRRWKGRALVVCHGRVLEPKAKTFTDVTAACDPRTASTGLWLNYPGCAGAAWDTRLKLPPSTPGKNLEEVHLALFCQRHRIPIWLLPRPADWLAWLLPEHAPGGRTIWAEEKAAGFPERSRLIAGQSRRHAWKVHRAA